jgi:hypothetical protein
VTEANRRLPASDAALAATFVLGIESKHGTLTIHDYQVAVQRLERAIRPWDTVVNVAPRVVGVHCTALTNAREVDAIAARLTEVVRAPMAVGDEIRTLGVCVGSAVVEPGEDPDDAMRRAREAMQHMRSARAGMLSPELPEPRDTRVALPH